MSESIFLNEEGKVDFKDTTPVILKICGKCKETRPTSDFSRGNGKDGLQGWCKLCHTMIRKEIKAGTRKAGTKLRAIEKLKEDEKSLAHLLIDEPGLSIAELAARTGLGITRVKGTLYNGKLLKALRALGSHHITRMIPKSLQALNEMLNQKGDLDIRFKAAVKVLESEKVMGPQRLEFGITDMKEESTERLLQIVKEARSFPEQVIQEAEVVE